MFYFGNRLVVFYKVSIFMFEEINFEKKEKDIKEIWFDVKLSFIVVF